MDVQARIDAIEEQIPTTGGFAARLRWLENAESDDRAFVADHAMGVSRFSEALAADIGFSSEMVSEISFAARWHDIGKLAIPDEVLRKPGKLDEREIAIMHKHAMAGQALLGDDAPQMMRDVAAYHHERYDGTGYEKLKGETIPLAARIVNVADVHDALIQARDYKKGMAEEDALMIMTNDAESPGLGRKSFDPFLLRRFVAMRLADPNFHAGPENRAALEAYARSQPMDDVPGGWEANDGWHVKMTGHRIRYERGENGNRKMVEMRGPTGELLFTMKGRENVAEAVAEVEDAPRR